MSDELVNLTIDGVPVSVAKGTMLIEAAKQSPGERLTSEHIRRAVDTRRDRNGQIVRRLQQGHDVRMLE